MPATVARKELVSQESRFAVKEDATIKTSHKKARELKLFSALDLEADAQAVADQAHEFFKVGKNRFQVTLAIKQFTFKPGMTVRLKSASLGIDKVVLVIGVQENADTRQVTLDVFG